MEGKKVSIVIPVVRPEGAERCEAAIRLNAGVSEDQYEVISIHDTAKVGCPDMMSKLTAAANNDLVMFLGDDTVPLQDFLREALEKMETLPQGWGVVGLNTEPNNPIAHWLADKRMLNLVPGGNFFSTEYRHCWCDNELYDIALENNRWVFAEKSYIDHLHPVNDSAEWDSHYQRAYSDDTKKYDFQVYCRRKRERMQAKYGTKLAIAVPLTDATVSAQFLFSFVKVITEYMTSLANDNKAMNIDILFPDFPAQIDCVRNNLVEQALKNGNTHILFMDTDQMYLTSHMAEQMLDHGKPVVGARVHRRYPGYDPLLLRGDIGSLESVPDEEIINKDGTFKTTIPVDFTGTGCILYDMKIFVDMIKDERKFFELTVGDKGQPVGEDIFFCQKLKDRGIPIVVDASIEVGHLCTQSADWGMYKVFKAINQNNNRRLQNGARVEGG